MEELQKRIQRLDGIKQIERLQRIYGYYRGYAEWEKYDGLFRDGPYHYKHPITGE